MGDAFKIWIPIYSTLLSLPLIAGLNLLFGWLRRSTLEAVAYMQRQDEEAAQHVSMRMADSTDVSQYVTRFRKKADAKMTKSRAKSSAKSRAKSRRSDKVAPLQLGGKSISVPPPLAITPRTQLQAGAQASPRQIGAAGAAGTVAEGEGEDEHKRRVEEMMARVDSLTRKEDTDHGHHLPLQSIHEDAMQHHEREDEDMKHLLRMLASPHAKNRAVAKEMMKHAHGQHGKMRAVTSKVGAAKAKAAEEAKPTSKHVLHSAAHFAKEVAAGLQEEVVVDGGLGEALGGDGGMGMGVVAVKDAICGARDAIEVDARVKKRKHLRRARQKRLAAALSTDRTVVESAKQFNPKALARLAQVERDEAKAGTIISAERRTRHMHLAQEFDWPGDKVHEFAGVQVPAIDRAKLSAKLKAELDPWKMSQMHAGERRQARVDADHEQKRLDTLIRARRPLRFAYLPICYALIVGVICVVVIAAVTAGMGPDVTKAWLECTVATLGLKWLFADPLGILIFGASSAHALQKQADGAGAGGDLAALL